MDANICHGVFRHVLESGVSLRMLGFFNAWNVNCSGGVDKSAAVKKYFRDADDRHVPHRYPCWVCVDGDGLLSLHHADWRAVTNIWQGPVSQSIGSQR